MEEGQTPDSVQGDQHFDQKLFMLCFQWKGETIDYTGEEREHTHEWTHEQFHPSKENVCVYLVKNPWARDRDRQREGW